MHAQERIKYCNFIEAAYKEINFENTTLDDPSLFEVRRIVGEIIRETGDVSTWDLRANFEVPNASALRFQRKQEIQFNPDFIQDAKDSGNPWVLYCIFAHKVSHHLCNHLLNEGDRLHEELQADERAGFILSRLGATLEEAQTAIHIYAQIHPTEHHPPRADRLKAIEKGWNRARKPWQDKATKLTDEADAAYDEGKFEIAFRKYGHVLSLNPNDSYAKNQLENCKVKLDSALASSDAFRIKNPGSFELDEEDIQIEAEGTIRQLFKAWENLQFEAYMSVWSEDALQVMRNGKTRNYADIYFTRKKQMSNSYQEVNVPHVGIEFIEVTTEEVFLKVEYSMEFHLTKDKVLYENEFEYYRLRPDATGKWLIVKNMDYIGD